MNNFVKILQSMEGKTVSSTSFSEEEPKIFLEFTDGTHVVIEVDEDFDLVLN